MSDLVTTAPTPPVAAVWRSVDELHQALRERAASINISREEINRHAGFTAGYVHKLLAPTPSKNLSVEGLCRLAPALGLDLALVVNPTYMERIAERSPPREASHAKHAGTVRIVFSMKHMRKIRRKGGENSRRYMSRRQAKILARRAAAARWAKEASRD
jgi:transcriptional regulator with XRE-family HTH domain